MCLSGAGREEEEAKKEEENKLVNNKGKGRGEQHDDKMEVK